MQVCAKPISIFKALNQDLDFYEELELPDPDLKGIHPYPLMKVRLTHWELTGDTSITITHSHVVGMLFHQSIGVAIHYSL